MAALRVDQHGVDAHRVELPFPPDVGAVVALAAADAIGALARLQHQAFAAERARGFALFGEAFPVPADDLRAQSQRQMGVAIRKRRDEAGEFGAPHVLRLGANVAAAEFQEIVGDEGDRQFGQRLRADGLAPEPLLQAGERREALERVGARPRLCASARRARRRARRLRAERRPAAPDRDRNPRSVPRRATKAARPPPRLTSCARMPSNFHSAIQSCGGPSVASISSTRPRPGLREIERIGLPGGERRALAVVDARDQRLEILGRGHAAGLRIAHHALRHMASRRRRATSESALMTCSRETPTRNSPVMSLKNTRRWSAGSACAKATRRAYFSSSVERPKRQQPLAHPDVERQVFRRVARRQQQGQRLGEIADIVVAFLDQPFRQARFLRPRAATAAASARSGAACRRRGNRRATPRSPRARVGLRRGEGLDQRRLFGARRGRLIEAAVEVGESLHASAASSSP